MIPQLQKIIQQLSSLNNDDILQQQTAWWLLEKITGLHQAILHTKTDIALSSEQQAQLNTYIYDYEHNHKPLQYILGSVPFGSLDILVEPPILIPRPETEEWCLNLIQQLKPIASKKLHILDIGSGSGCITLALAHALPKSMVYAVDIAPQALALTHKNMFHNKIYNVTTVQSDVYNQLPTDLRYDLIVSNPPYVNPEALQQLDASVQKWEDLQALIAPDSGLAIIKRIITQAPHFLTQKKDYVTESIPHLVIEIGYDQGASVQQLMHDAGYVNITCLQDLQGKDRVVTGRIK